MVRNVGGTEKVIRLVGGGYLVLGAFFLDFPTWSTATLSVVGIVALLTGSWGTVRHGRSLELIRVGSIPKHNQGADKCNRTSF